MGVTEAFDVTEDRGEEEEKGRSGANELALNPHVDNRYSSTLSTYANAS